MNAQYITNRKRLNEEKGTSQFRSIHIAQSIWRAYWRKKIETIPTENVDIYELTLKLGIETLPKIDHDGIYSGRMQAFYWYLGDKISSHLKDLAKAEPKEEENE